MDDEAPAAAPATEKGPTHFMVCMDGAQQAFIPEGDPEEVATTGERAALDMALRLKTEDPDHLVSIVVVPTEVVTETLEDGRVRRLLYCLPREEGDDPLETSYAEPTAAG